MRILPILLLSTASLWSPSAAAATSAQYGAKLEGFKYPHEVHTFTLQSQQQSLQMAYMDVMPVTHNGRSVLLLHGKNYCSATWESAIAALTEAGFRVIAPDQIGFCKSDKPAHYQFSLQQLADNTRLLLTHLKVDQTIVVGHSMGGMLAARYALLFPKATTQLVLVNPIGLEDWSAAGVPWRSVDAWYAGEQRTSFQTIQSYQREVYFGGDWKPEYDRWVGMLAGMYAGPGRQRVAWNQALTSDMVFTQPVIHEFGQIQVPTTLLIGLKDRTAIGRDRASPEVKARIGNYPELGKRTAQAIPGARLVEFEDLGHSPQVQAPERFNAALLEALQ